MLCDGDRRWLVGRAGKGCPMGNVDVRSIDG